MLLIAYGTRPEYIKILPIMKELDSRGIEFKVVEVKQHTDLTKEPAYKSDKEIFVYSDFQCNRLDTIVSDCLDGEIDFTDIDYVLVQGDTATAFAMALLAFHRKIPVMHVEAGLRTYDRENPYPEESYRKMISTMATIHFCPSEVAKKNLWAEGCDMDNVFLTGNTSIDNLVDREPTLKDDNTIIVTLHRRENHDNLPHWFQAINDLAELYPEFSFIIPLHPNPNVQKYKDKLKNLVVVSPVGHKIMLDWLSSCRAVITDSGGIQEECSWFRKTCFVCRKKTERPCSSSILCKTPQELLTHFPNSLNRNEKKEFPFGKGTAAVKIGEIIEELLGAV